MRDTNYAWEIFGRWMALAFSILCITLACYTAEEPIGIFLRAWCVVLGGLFAHVAFSK